eukprot:scaffold88465_cov63-Phaeocystis_antarctica.AAC.4
MWRRGAAAWEKSRLGGSSRLGGWVGAYRAGHPPGAQPQPARASSAASRVATRRRPSASRWRPTRVRTEGL